MPLGAGQITRTTADKFIPELWMDETRDYLMAKLVMANLVKFESLTGSKGDTIHIPDVSELVTNDKAANTQVSPQAFTETEFTMTITKHKEVSFVLEDIVKVQSKYDLRTIYTRGIGYTIAKKIDTDIFALQATVTRRVIGSDGTTAFATAGAGNGTDLTEVGLRNAMEVQDVALVDDERYLVIHPSQKNALLGIARFTEYQMLGPGGIPIRTGQFGEIFGVPVFVTTQTPAVTSAGPVNTFFGNFLFSREAFMLVQQLTPRVQAQYKQEYLGWLVTGDCIYDVAIFRNPFATVLFGPA
jgi:N4-gp56 family major capsid protein